MSTSECSCRLWPTPGIYVVTSMPFVRRTRATLRSAEFGFLGVWVKTRTQTPRFCGLFCKAGLFVLLTIFFRPARTSWLMVGIHLRKGARPLCWNRTPQTTKDGTADAFAVSTAHAGVPLPESLQAWKPQGLAPENLSYPMLVVVARLNGSSQERGCTVFPEDASCEFRS